MVNCEVIVTDPTGKAIENIPIDIYVTACQWYGGTGNNYHVYGVTNADGQFILSQAQAGCEFEITANSTTSSDYQSNWSTGYGTTSTNLINGGYSVITLNPTVQPTNGQCPSGYTLNQTTGLCVKDSQSNTLLTFNWLDIILVVVIMIVIVASFFKFFHKGGKRH